MSNSLDLFELREKELKILRNFDSFCKEKDIPYFLSNGTLLGAVKYGGFIPWDDDIDVVLLREDYDRFINEYFDSRYILFETRKNNRFRYPFAKLSDPDTVLNETDVNNGVNLGVNIDIFPLDYINLYFKNAKKLSLKLHNASMLLLYSKRKIRYKKELGFKQNAIDIFYGICSKVIPPRLYVKYIQKKAQMFKGEKKSKYLAMLCWSVYKGREVMPAEVYEKTVKVSFEGEEYPAPVGYDKYLRNLYGDYEKDPPKEKQKTHHFFKAYNKKDI